MGVLHPNKQYNIYWNKYDRLSIDLVLSWSYPKAQPLPPLCKTAPSQTFSNVRLPRIGRLNFPDVQPLLSPLLEWEWAGVQIPQHQVVDILEFAETKNVSLSAG